MFRAFRVVIIQPARVEAEADDIQTDGGQQFHGRFILDQLTKVMRLFDVTRDHPPEAVQTMFLDRHPHLERAELTRQLQTHSR